MRHPSHVFVLIGAAALVVALFASGAAAEGSRTVAGYRLTVGFRQEPAHVEEANAVVLRIVDGAGQPVQGAQQGLQLEIANSGHQQVLPLRPVRNRAGEYEAVFVPPSGGRYTLRLFGRLGDASLDERFESGPGGFGADVTTRSSYDFGSAGGMLALALLGVYLAGMAVIAVRMLRRRGHDAAGARG